MCGGTDCDYYDSPTSIVPLPLKAMAAAGRSFDSIIETAQSGECLCNECRQSSIETAHHAKQEPSMSSVKTIAVTATEAAKALFRTHIIPGVQSMTPSDAIEYLEALHELTTEMLYQDSSEPEIITEVPISESEPKPHGLNAIQIQGMLVRVRSSGGVIITSGKVVGMVGDDVKIATKHGYFYRQPEQLELYGE